MHSSAAACTRGYNNFRVGTNSNITVKDSAGKKKSISYSHHQVAVVSFEQSRKENSRICFNLVANKETNQLSFI